MSLEVKIKEGWEEKRDEKIENSDATFIKLLCKPSTST